MQTTTAPKIFNSTPSTHHNLNPFHAFDIEFAGYASSIFAQKIAHKLPCMFAHAHTADSFVQLVTCEGIPQQIASGNHEWVQVTNFDDHVGIDYFEPSTCEVRTAQGDLLAASTVPGREMHECIPRQILDGRSKTIFVKILHEARITYRITSGNPFDPKLMLVQNDDVLASQYVRHFQYDGKIINRRLEHHDICSHTMKFLSS